ncbi:unnamed protein product, partial [Bubo scandiacus]
MPRMQEQEGAEVLKRSKDLMNFEFRKKQDTIYRYLWHIQKVNLDFRNYINIYATLERGTEALEFH